MKEILKIIYIAVCLAVCLYPIYRWIEDAVYEDLISNIFIIRTVAVIKLQG